MTTVGVNLLWCRPGRVGGSEEYTTRLIDGVAALSDAPTLALFASPALVAAHPSLVTAGHVERPPVAFGGRAGRVALERTWLRRRAHSVDVVHHAGGTAPPVPRPIVLTIHDLQYRAFPEFFSRTKRAFLRMTVPAGARRAAVIVVPSEFVRDDVHDAFAVPLERIVVVHHGLPPAAPIGAGDVRERYTLPERFVVYPAVTWPHKNHAVLVEALARLDGDHADIGLVLTGGAGPNDDAIDTLAAHRHVAGRVRRLGRVPAADLGALYTAAVALAFPSRYEGFGAPAIEAMAAGCPVLAAAATALPGVVGAAGILLAPDDADAWAAAIGRVAGDHDERVRLVAAGRARAAEFDVARSAARLVAAYRQALA